jgi:CheY-like chemotaxis protein
LTLAVGDSHVINCSVGPRLEDYGNTRRGWVSSFQPTASFDFRQQLHCPHAGGLRYAHLSATFDMYGAAPTPSRDRSRLQLALRAHACAAIRPAGGWFDEEGAVMGSFDGTDGRFFTQRPDKSRLRVLIVDDNPINLDAARKIFGLWGIEPVLAHDGLEAVKLIADEAFDFVLMDIVMPVMDGYAATICIRRFERENPSRRPVPVVAYSTSNVANDAKSLRALGFSEAVMKPSSPDRLQECLSRWCPDRLDGSAKAQEQVQAR